MNEVILLIKSIFLMTSGFLFTYHHKQHGTVFVSFMVLLANIFIVKQIDLFGLHVTASDAYFIAAACTLNVIQEMYGRQAAKEAMTLSFTGLILFSLMSQLQFLYEANEFDHVSHAIYQVFHVSLRISLASLLSYWLTQRLDLMLYRITRQLSFSHVAACFISVSLSQFCDTLLFSVLALSGIVANIWHVMFFSYSVKLIVLAVSVAVMGVLYRMLDWLNGLYESKV